MEVLKSLGTIILVLGVLAIAGLIINVLGYLARNSKVWKAVSIVVLLLVGGFLFLGILVEPESPFGLTLTCDAHGQVKKIEFDRSPIQIKVKFKAVETNALVFTDEAGREFSVALQGGRLPPGNTHVALLAPPHLAGWFYLIESLGPSWLVVTFGSLSAFIMSMVAVLVVWLSGMEGKIAFLTISSDD